MRMKYLSQLPQKMEAATEVETLGVALGRIRARMAALEALIRARSSKGDTGALLCGPKCAQARRSPDEGSSLHEDHALLREQAEALESAIRSRRPPLVIRSTMQSPERSAAVLPVLEDVRKCATREHLVEGAA